MKIEFDGEISLYRNRVRTPVLNKGTTDDVRNEILRYFHQTYSISEQLFENVLRKNDSFYTRADPLRHPLIFYYGHTAVFYVNKFILMNLTSERINPAFESLLAVGVDENSWDELDEENYRWPTVSEVKSYRNKVRSYVDRIIREVHIKVPITWNDPVWTVLMTIEHELVHFETSSVLIRQLPLNLVRQHEDFDYCKTTKQTDPPENKLIKVPGGSVCLGRDRSPDVHQYYAWDNELGTAEYQIADFYASKYLVSNSEFLKFVQGDGYKTRKWWSIEGWHWRSSEKATQPRFWRKNGQNSYKLRLMTCEVDMPWSWPVEVNLHESQAFCNWLSAEKGLEIRMGTEAEIVYLKNKEISTFYPEWQEAPSNIDLSNWASCCPVDYFKHGQFYDLIGNLWQWTSTDFYPFPGFQVHPAYEDYSRLMFGGHHGLMIGGSWATIGEAASHTVRYAFRRHIYQHAGFRYVHGSNPPVNAERAFYNMSTDIEMMDVETKRNTSPTKLAFFEDLEPSTGNFLQDTIDGLSKTPKALLAMYFYDSAGSRLFDEICDLEEYYLTRTELKIMENISAELGRMAGTGVQLIEIGSGSNIKIRNLLDSLDKPDSVVSLDVSGDHLLQACINLAKDYPGVKVGAVCADFMQPMPTLTRLNNDHGLTLAYFPGISYISGFVRNFAENLGSTIGNFYHDEAVTLLSNIKTIVGSGGALLIGVDLVKDTKVLEAAYNDRKGITAAFNKNLLVRIKRELGAKLQVEKFQHLAFYNEVESRIETYLVSEEKQQIQIGSHCFTLEQGERIHTENSHKYSIESFEYIARKAGFEPVRCWCDNDNLFSIHWLAVPTNT